MAQRPIGRLAISSEGAIDNSFALDDVFHDCSFKMGTNPSPRNEQPTRR